MYIDQLYNDIQSIKEIRPIGKNITIDGVFCHCMGLELRNDGTLHMLVLEYDEEYRDRAEAEAKIDTLATKYQLNFDTTEINELFRDYVMEQFGKLFSEMSRETAVLVSRAMEYMHDQLQQVRDYCNGRYV